MTRLPIPRRDDFPLHLAVATRWIDNDVYGHVNNAAYYSFFDTAVNRFLISRGVLDIAEGEVIGLVVETGCRYFRPLAFPADLEIGLRVDHVGRTSVRYGLGVFSGEDLEAAAEGHFVHVYVDRESRRPVVLPEALRAAVAALGGGG